jgi:hypothetical protein
LTAASLKMMPVIFEGLYLDLAFIIVSSFAFIENFQHLFPEIPVIGTIGLTLHNLFLN